MTIEHMNTNPEFSYAAEKVLELSQFAMGFARVDRSTVMPDGRNESDVEHSFMLTLIAPVLVRLFSYDLDEDKVVMFALVHDMAEFYTGDTPTINISEEDMIRKEAAEDEAVKRLVGELPLPWAGMLLRYHIQEEPEARFVRLVDKLLPTALNLIVPPENLTYIAEQGLTSEDEFRVAKLKKQTKLQAEYPDFPEVLDLRVELDNLVIEHLYPSSQAS